jgi:hypothetical protein
MDVNKRRIVVASLAAVVTAAGLLVTVVLPAEYGWDPLGTGKAMGLSGLSEGQQRALDQQATPWQSDIIEFPLQPFEAVEYKYRLEEGASLLYSWQAEGDVLYEMHAEPDGAAPGYAETFAKTDAAADQGAYKAPYGGIHGWFWQNRGQQAVTIRLQAQGYFSYSVRMADGHVYRREFPELAD